MTRFFISLVCVVFALACGAEPPEATGGSVIGTAQQAVYLPYLYGTEGGTDSDGTKRRCDDDWSADECWVPNSKVHYTTFQAGTCSSWWQARFVEVWWEMTYNINTYLNTHLHDDAPEWWLGSAEGSGLPNGLIHQWRCDGARGVAYGSYKPNGSNADDIDAGSLGTLKQYKGGVLRIYSAEIEALQVWAAADDAKRQKFARSLIRHELAHQFGNGHDDAYLMGDLNTFNWFNSEAYWQQYIYDAMACYNPSNGGLFADC